MNIRNLTPWSFAFAIVAICFFGGCNGSKELTPSETATSESTEEETPSAEMASQPAFNGVFSQIAPTLSARKPSQPHENIKYVDQATNNREFVQAIRKTLQRCVDHFAKIHEGVEGVDEGSKYINDSFDAIYESLPRERKASLWSKGNELMSSEMLSNDPLFLTCVALMGNFSGHKIESVNLAQKAIRRHQELDYPTPAVLRAHQTLVAAREILPQNAGNYSFGNYADALYYWLTEDFCEDGNEVRVAWSFVKSMLDDVPDGQGFVTRSFLERASADKRIPDWIRSMLLGHHENKVAWDLRGSGTSDTVTRDGWEKFRYHQQIAATHFEEALEICPYFPEPASEMIDIARAGNIETDYEHWFRRAVEIQFDYYPAYESMLFSLYPRWHGNGKMMYEFAQECYETGRYDTFVPYFFFRGISSLHSSGEAMSDENFRTLFMAPETRATMLDIIDHLLETKEPVYMGITRLSENRLKSMKFMLLFDDKRYEEARVLLDNMNYSLSEEAGQSHEGLFRSF
ncbi:MAG: hypothetical protein R3C03_22230 [Pirellulaceae bacterium]